jgi:hypothetical protein
VPFQAAVQSEFFRSLQSCVLIRDLTSQNSRALTQNHEHVGCFGGVRLLEDIDRPPDKTTSLTIRKAE